MRLAEIDETDGSMLQALTEEYTSHRTTDHLLLRMVVQQLDRLTRQMVALHGGDPPEPVEVRLPGDPEPEKPTLRSIAGRMMRGR